jgi:uncharacterized protein (TIGR00730 family)
MDNLSVIKSVAIFGSADVNDGHPVYRDAYRAAQKLGEHGIRVVNGGGPGVMKAATDGARSVGASTLSVTFEPIDAPFFEGKLPTNKPDREIKTPDYVERLKGLIDASDAYVIFQGGTGTLSEWTTVWLLSHIYYGHHKPFILYGDFWHEVIEVIQKNFFIGKMEHKVFAIVNSPEEMWSELERFDKEVSAFQKPTF